MPLHIIVSKVTWMSYSSNFTLGIKGTKLKTQLGIMAFWVRQLETQLEIKITIGGIEKGEPELKFFLLSDIYWFFNLSKSLLWNWFLAYEINGALD